jgi:hypothetical protein
MLAWWLLLIISAILGNTSSKFKTERLERGGDSTVLQNTPHKTGLVEWLKW